MGKYLSEEDTFGPNSPVQRELRRLLAVAGARNPERFEFRPPEVIQQKLLKAIESLRGEKRRYVIKRQDWETGDFALIDNMALASLPAAGADLPPKSPDLDTLIFHRTAIVDPEAVPINFRGAPSVLLAGSGLRKDPPSLTGSAFGGIEEAEAMRYISFALFAVYPELGDSGGIPQEKPKKEALPAREEAELELQRGGFSLDILDEVDQEIESAKATGKKTLTKTLRKLMMDLHPDRNQDREDEVTPVFQYIKRVRSDQKEMIRLMMREDNKVKLVSKLRQKSKEKEAASSSNS